MDFKKLTTEGCKVNEVKELMDSARAVKIRSNLSTTELSPFNLTDDPAHTFDGMLVYNIFLYGIPTTLQRKSIKKYFCQFGNVNKMVINENNDLGPTYKGPQRGYITFFEYTAASRVLKQNLHIICNNPVYVSASHSWHHPGTLSLMHVTSKPTSDYNILDNIARNRRCEIQRAGIIDRFISKVGHSNIFDMNIEPDSLLQVRKYAELYAKYNDQRIDDDMDRGSRIVTYYGSTEEIMRLKELHVESYSKVNTYKIMDLLKAVELKDLHSWKKFRFSSNVRYSHLSDNFHITDGILAKENLMLKLDNPDIISNILISTADTKHLLRTNTFNELISVNCMGINSTLFHEVVAILMKYQPHRMHALLFNIRRNYVKSSQFQNLFYTNILKALIRSTCAGKSHPSQLNAITLPAPFDLAAQDDNQID